MTSNQAEMLLKQLCVDAHHRTEASMRLIYQICMEQADRGSQDYSVATIGKLSAERGGPSTGAIRNKTGEKYRALIAACADQHKGHKRKRTSPKDDAVDEILEGITDPVLRTRVGLMKAELKALRGQVLALRRISSEKAFIELPVQAGQPTERHGSTLTDQQRRALKDSISTQTLSHWGWLVDKSGRIVDEETKQVVFGAGFVSAIENVLRTI